MLAALCLIALGALNTNSAKAASAAEIDSQVDQALAKLHSSTPATVDLTDKAKGVLVFPNIVKAGFGIGGQFGEGALRVNGATTGYYNTVAASIGWQIGAQSYSQVLFFMTDDAMNYLDSSEGFEVGVDANAVLATVGAGGDLSSSTLQAPIIAFVFGQQGLMAGITIEGSKITKIDK